MQKTTYIFNKFPESILKTQIGKFSRKLFQKVNNAGYQVRSGVTAFNFPVASTNLKDFSRNSRKFQKSPKCEKAHVCKNTACALNLVKFYKILENTEKISKLNFQN